MRSSGLPTGGGLTAPPLFAAAAAIAIAAAAAAPTAAAEGVPLLLTVLAGLPKGTLKSTGCCTVGFGTDG
jgi:hypothetical protein